MSELRLDQLTGRWVVVAGERSQRPGDFLPRRLPVEDEARRCPFCPGNEDPADPVLRSYSREGPSSPWQVQVVSNRYPAFSGNEPMVVSHIGPVFTQAPATGLHEVLVLTPSHLSSWADLTDEHASLVMHALQDRMIEHAMTPGLRYSQAVVNCGREAGASIEHPHGQILSMPFIPGEAAHELGGFARFSGNCLLCAVAEAEQEAGHRLVYTDERVIMHCPYWAGTPYELLIIPRVHQPHLHDSGSDDLDSVGVAVKRALGALRSCLGDVAYNIYFHSAPFRTSADFHWHVHLMPKISTRGGFEMGSGVLINVVPPERSAGELRVQVGAAA